MILAAAVLLGCGDDRLSTGEYRDEARKICEESERQLGQIQLPTRLTSRSVADYFRRQLRITERNVARFDGLEPPEELEARHDRIVRLGREGIAEIRSLVEAIDEGRDPREVLTGAQDELRRIGADQRAAARALGVPECSD